MAQVTRLHANGTPGRLFGSFAGKAGAAQAGAFNVVKVGMFVPGGTVHGVFVPGGTAHGVFVPGGVAHGVDT